MNVPYIVTISYHDTSTCHSLAALLYQSCISQKSGYEACSGNKLKFNPAVGTDITNGVYELRMNSYNGNNVDSSTVAWAAVGAMPSGMTDAYDYTYYVLPGNVDFGGAAAWAYLPGTMSVYKNDYGSDYIVMLHELGHNLGHHHSGLGSASYGEYGLDPSEAT